MSLDSKINFGDEVAAALEDDGAVVALESALIGGSTPYPRNLEAVRMVESAIRSEGAVPAMIGVVAGRLTVGMTTNEQENFAQSANKVIKASTRDLPIVLAQGAHGATTVAATLLCAGKAGIRVFAGGAIGGVHRGYADQFDISPDLDEIARQDVAVVCTGAKAILDVPNTIEYLETRGVPIVGFRIGDFPAYYAGTGIPVDGRAESPREIADIMDAKWSIGLPGGILVVNAIPDGFALDPIETEKNISIALGEAAQQRITGKEITGFLLKRLFAQTEGRALEAGLAATQCNARLAARVAVEYAVIAKNTKKVGNPADWLPAASPLARVKNKRN